MNIRQIAGALTQHYGKLPNPENAALVRRAAAEGIVLLKNDGALPLRPGPIALFGAGGVDTIICGTGSGYVCAPYTVTVKKGLEDAGFTLTSWRWLKRFAEESRLANKKDKTLSLLDRRWSGRSILIDEPEIQAAELSEAQRADTAIYVIRRSAGEEKDRAAVKGDYYLSDRERRNLEQVAAAFAHTVVVLNTCVIDANFIEEIPGIDAAVYIGLGGMEAGNALADVLTGQTGPSGRLTDTWARQYSDYPAAETFSSNDGITAQEDYAEDIYVGYRWFDSMGIEPLYPFGFGMSYTVFRQELLSAAADWRELRLTVQVENTGAASGREVVQLYISAPSGRLDKPFQELKCYAKTDELAPGEKQILTLTVPTEALASFDEEMTAFVMEPGSYFLRLGSHSRDTEIAAVLTLDGETVVRKVTDVLRQDRPLNKKIPPARASEVIPDKAVRLVLRSADCKTADNVSRIPKTVTTYIPEGKEYTPYAASNRYQMPVPCQEVVAPVRSLPNSTFLDVCGGKVTVEEFVASLEPEVLARIVTGTLEETPYKTRDRLHRKIKLPSVPQSSGQTTGQFTDSLGIPPAYLFDGPAGMHIIGCAATAFPVGMTGAQTWDQELLYKLGEAFGRDMTSYHVTIGLGPGMNIHRDPLCGRSFEYYSEDPVLTGKSAAAFTQGVQSVKGRGVAIKHFDTNNQENDRLILNNTVSTRALREIYLRGFEICVREAKPMTVMTSYNKLNGLYTSENRELITDVLRGEWGFDGFVMTDWGTNSEKGWDLHAGNDLIMGGYRAEKLLVMMRQEAPRFEPGGSVQEIVNTSHFGFVKTKLANWGSFVPDAHGKDTVSVTVTPGTKIDEKVKAAVRDGVASLSENADGSVTVAWHGIERGAYLPLGDLQSCAIRILNSLKNSAAAHEMFAAVRQRQEGHHAD